MSRVTRFKLQDGTPTVRDVHPRELSYNVGAENLKALMSEIQHNHKEWSREDCRRAAIEELSKGLLGHITSIS